MINIAVCKTQMPPHPFTNMWRVGLTFDLDLLTWLSIGIIYSSRTSTYQFWTSTCQFWSFWGKAFLSYPLHKVWKTDMTFDLDLDLWPTDLTIPRDHLLIKDYLPTKFEASGEKRSWVIRCKLCGNWNIILWNCSCFATIVHKVWKSDMTFDLDLWPTDLTIPRDHLLIKDYLPTKFEASGAKHSWVIRCTRFGRLTWPLTLTFDLLTWLSIGIIYSSRTIYLPSLKLLGQSVLELSVAQG